MVRCEHVCSIHMSQHHRNQILEKLTNARVPFTHHVHEAVTTSEHASEIRGVPLHSGAKALVLQLARKDNQELHDHILVIIPGDVRIDFAKLKQITGNKYEFAKNPTDLVDCVPGSVPPFGSVLELTTYADKTLADDLNFNIGLLTESVGMKKEDYIKVENPILVDVVKTN